MTKVLPAQRPMQQEDGVYTLPVAAAKLGITRIRLHQLYEDKQFAKRFPCEWRYDKVWNRRYRVIRREVVEHIRQYRKGLAALALGDDDPICLSPVAPLAD